MTDDDRPALTVGRSLGAVGGGLAAGAATTVGVAMIAGAAGSGGSSPTDGLGVLLVGLAGGVFLGCLVAALVVLFSVRGRRHGTRFSGLFSAGLALLLAFVAIGIVGGLAAPVTDVVGAGALAWVLVPLLWSVPAAAARVVRARWVGWVAALGLVAVVATVGVADVRADRQQARYDAAWDGPVLVPGESPGSPVDGWLLRQVSLPGEYSDLSYSYVSPGDQVVQDDGTVTGGDVPDTYYQVRLVPPSDVDTYAPCASAGSSCRSVGTALGGEVLADDSSSTWVVRLTDGAVSVEGSLDDDEALAVLDDLRPAGFDEVHDLRVDPDVAV